MKLKTSKQSVRENYYKIISVGYCDLESLLSFEAPFGYSAGVYGWACDYYAINGVCISTGYQPINNKNVKFDYEIVREYNNKARGKNREEKEELLKQFMAEVLK